MPDITMCDNPECPLRRMCHRHEAKPSDYQSFSHFEPTNDKNCDHFMEIGGEV